MPSVFFASTAVKDLKGTEVSIGVPYTLRIELDTWTNSTIDVKLQSALFNASPKTVPVTVPAAPKRRLIGPAKKPIIEVPVTFDKWVAGDQKVTIVLNGAAYTVGTRPEITLRALGVAAEFEAGANWIKDTAGVAADTNKPLKKATEYDIQLKLKSKLNQVLKAKVKSAAFEQAEYEATFAANQDTATVRVKTKGECLNWTDVEVAAGDGTVTGGNIEQTVQVGWKLEFPAKPFLIDKKGKKKAVSLEEVEIGKEYTIQFQLSHWVAVDAGKIKLRSALLGGEKEFDLTPIPPDPARKGKISSKTAYVEAKVTFDTCYPAPEKVEIVAGTTYMVGAAKELTLKATGIAVEFDSPWLTSSSGDALPDQNALELYRAYKVHVKLPAAAAQEVKVRIVSDAFRECPVEVKIPAGATKAASIDLYTGKPLDDWTDVKLVAAANCSVSADSTRQCWVEAPVVSFAESPVSTALAAVQNLLGLWPGKHMLHFALSYAPHPLPPAVAPRPGFTPPPIPGPSQFLLKSTAFAGDVTVPLPTGVTSFNHEVEFNEPTKGAVPIEFNTPAGCISAMSRVGKLRKSEVPAFIRIAIGETKITFQGIGGSPYYEDGQKVKVLFRLTGVAGNNGAKATLKCNAFTTDIDAIFPRYAADGTEIEVEGTIVSVASLRALSPVPRRTFNGYEHEIKFAAGDGCALVEIFKREGFTNGNFGPAKETNWVANFPRPTIVFDPQTTKQGPYKPGEKFPVRLVLQNGPPKHADIEVEVECPSVMGSPHKVTFSKAAGESEKILELEVADVLDPKGIDKTKFPDYVLKGTPYTKRLFDMVTLKSDAMVNCVVSGADAEHAVPAVLIRLNLLQVSFHRDHPFRPEEGLLNEEKIWFTVTHSYPAPAGAKIDLISNEKGGKKAFPDQLDLPLAEGKLMTIFEVTASTDLPRNAKYKVEIQPKTLCIKGEKDVKTVPTHIPATLMFGGKRKHRIEPEGPYEPGQNVTLTVHLEYHPRGRANVVAPAPAGGCNFIIECAGFKGGTVSGTIPAGRSEAVITAELEAAGTHPVNLKLDNGAGAAVMAFKGCRVDSEAKDNSFEIEIGAPVRRMVSFEDTSTALIIGADQPPNSTKILTVKLSGPAPQRGEGKATVARVSSKAFASSYLVEFRPGEVSKAVTVTWANPSPDRQVVRVDGIKRCEADTKTASTRADAGLAGVANRQAMFSVKVPPPGPPTPVTPCPQVASAIARTAASPCAFPEFSIVERHGERCEVAPERGPRRDGVYPVPATPLVQVIAGRKADWRAAEFGRFHRTEILFRFPGANVVKEESHHLAAIHPAIYLYRIDRKGNRLAVLPVNPLSEEPNRTLDIAPGFWDVRFPVVAGTDIRGLQVHQATLPLFETKNSKSGFFPGVWNKIKRNIPMVDFWNMVRQQKPRINQYEVEVSDCATASRKVRLEVYPSDEYSLKISVKPFAPFSWGLDGAVVDSWGKVKPRDDLRTKSWESQYADTTDYLKADLKLRDQSPIGGLSVPGSALSMTEINSKQGRGRIPKATVASLNDLSTSAPPSLGPDHEIVFQIAESFGTGPAPTTLTKGGLAVTPGDYVLWDGESDSFFKVPKPGALLWTVADLNALTPDHRQVYKLKSAGAIKPGLVFEEGQFSPGELTVNTGDYVVFDSKFRKWFQSSSRSFEVAQLNARDRKDGSIRKLTDAGRLTQGAIDVAAGNYVIWRADRKAWEKLEETTVEELSNFADGVIHLDMRGTQFNGAKRWNAGENAWKPLQRKTIAELKERVLEVNGTYSVSGRGTIGGIDVDDNDALIWDGAAWKKLERKRVEDINPLAKDADLVRTTGALTINGVTFDAGDVLQFQAGAWSKLPQEHAATIDAINPPAAGEVHVLEDSGVLTNHGGIAVTAGDVVKYAGSAWTIIVVPGKDPAWFARTDFQADDCYVMGNSGKIEAGGVTVAAGDVVKFDGNDWSEGDIAGRHPVAFYNDEIVKPDDQFVVSDAGQLGTVTVAANDIVKFVAGGTWSKVAHTNMPKWQSGWFDWVPAEGEAYVLSNTGTINGVPFGTANMVAIRTGGAWQAGTEECCDATVELLNQPLMDQGVYKVTDPGTLKAGALAVVADDLVKWEAGTSTWTKIDKTIVVEWDPDDFNEREENLLNTFVMKDAGTLDKGGLAVAVDDFVKYNSKESKWETAPAPENSRSVKSIGVFDDSQWVARISGGDGRMPLTSTAPFRSSYCFYPGDAQGGLPESWQQQYTATVPTTTPPNPDAPAPTPVLQADAVQKELDKTSVYAGFIPGFIGDRISIAMTRNGKEDTLCAEFRRLAYTIAFIAQNFKSLTDSAENAVPTMGYSVSAVINIFEGDLLVRWGWKEFTDHQVFYWEQVHANLLVFRIGARVDLGFRYNVMVARFEAIIYFKITLELRWEKAWERRGPGEPMTGDSAWTAVTGKVELGASIVLLHENWLSANVATSSGIEARFRWISRNAGGCEYQVYFLGIILNAKLKILAFKEIAFTKALKKGSPPGIPWKRGMLPGAANPSYFDIRATFGLNMSKIIWDRNHLASALESMIEVQQDVLRKRTHKAGPAPPPPPPPPGSPAPPCSVCHANGVQPIPRGWPVAIRPEEPGWDDQWDQWVKSHAAEATTLPVRKIMRYAVNAVVKESLHLKLPKMETERKKLLVLVQDRLALAEKKLDEIASLEKRVDEAEEAGDERAETLDELMALAEETEDWMLEVRNDDPDKAAADRHSISKLVKNIRWWCRRMEHYTSFQKHWGTVGQ